MWLSEIPASAVPILMAYGVMSVATLIAYAADKSAARRGPRRVPERTLHLLALLGGWPGALIAMPLLHHKRRKAGFVAILWLIVLTHLAVIVTVVLRA